MDIITLDEEYCGNCNSYIGLLETSGLCPRCQREIGAQEEEFDDGYGFYREPEPTSEEEQEALDELQVTDPETYNYIKHAEYDPEPSDDDVANEDELPHTEISPLALPRNEKPRRKGAIRCP